MTIDEYFEWEYGEFAEQRNRDPDWRLGMAYYVQFDKTGLPFEELFYETDDNEARNMIFEFYING